MSQREQTATVDQHEEAWAKIHDLLAAGHWARARAIFDKAVSSAAIASICEVDGCLALENNYRGKLANCYGEQTRSGDRQKQCSASSPSPVAWSAWTSNGDGTESLKVELGVEVPVLLREGRDLRALYEAPQFSEPSTFGPGVEAAVANGDYGAAYGLQIDHEMSLAPSATARKCVRDMSDGRCSYPNCMCLPKETEWRPIATAPKNGTLVFLLIAPDEERVHPLEDTAGMSRTIGQNNFDNDGEDKWEFAGWSWSHDHYTQGDGNPACWMPLPEAAK